jgi:hypothetical protein
MSSTNDSIRRVNDSRQNRNESEIEQLKIDVKDEVQITQLSILESNVDPVLKGNSPRRSKLIQFQFSND